MIPREVVAELHAQLKKTENKASHTPMTGAERSSVEFQGIMARAFVTLLASMTEDAPEGP
jgi:hypothetical protein